MMAAESGHLAVCDYLVRQGADINITNTRGTDCFLDNEHLNLY
jgi:ankyrin repeat protein